MSARSRHASVVDGVGRGLIAEVKVLGGVGSIAADLNPFPACYGFRELGGDLALSGQPIYLLAFAELKAHRKPTDEKASQGFLLTAEGGVVPPSGLLKSPPRTTYFEFVCWVV